MEKSKKSKLTCRRCNISVGKKDTFCPNCGGIFSDDVCCTKHKSVHAEGVCVICSKPFCAKCGMDGEKVFLCNMHSEYETFEGMARVFGSMDNVRAQFADTCLKQAGYHPFMYTRKYNPVADKVSITPLRNFGNHPDIEQKILVPFSEVLKAVKELKKYKFKEV
jgi:hypothetical protein